MRIAIDPRTGHPVRPSPEQTRAMGATSAHAAEAPLEAVSLPGGGWLVRLDERYMQSSIARRDSTGGFHIDCVPGGTQLERIPRRPWTPPSRPVAE